MRIEWIEKYLTEAETLIYEKNVDGGLALLHKLLYEEPGYGSLHNHLGWAYFYHTMDMERAERHLQYAIRFGTEFGAPYQHLGNLYIRQARYNEAVEVFEKGLTLANANRAAILEGIAHAYELKKEFGKAIRYFKEAMVSTTGHETVAFAEGIRRCRKKRWVMLFAF